MEPDDDIRDKLRAAIREEPGLTLCGEARDWSYCDYLLQEWVPELLVARIAMVASHWWDIPEQESCFPLVIGLGEVSGCELLSNRLLETLTLPVSDAGMRQCLARAHCEIYTRKAEELSYLLKRYTSSTARSMYLATITVEHEGRKFNLDTRTILAVLANANYCRLHTIGGVYEIRDTMTSLVAKLDPTQFARIHRSAIVNMSQIREIAVNRDVATAVVLNDGTELPIGPNFRQTVGTLPFAKRA
jgi:two-component system LytT family response regulator